MTLQDYLRNRHKWEFAIVIGILLIGWATNVGVEVLGDYRDGGDGSIRLQAILEATSHIAVLIALPLILWLERQVPLSLAHPFRSGLAHVLFSVVFSLIHVGVMYGLRRLASITGLLDFDYRWTNWPSEFAFEYLKDVKLYMLVIIIVYLYRFMLRRLQGEAGFIAEQDQTETEVPERILVKKLGSEFLVRTSEIEWIEACGNYVNLHVGDSVYMLRETMSRIQERLAPLGFQRIHRSAIVCLARVNEIRANPSGDGEVVLESGKRLPVSRRYRNELRESLA